MVKYRVIWRRKAEEDLLGIVRYIARDNVQAARTFGKRLRASTQPLVDHPELAREGRFPGIRELVAHPNYVVFYRVDSKAKVVEVLRLKHAAQHPDLQAPEK